VEVSGCHRCSSSRNEGRLKAIFSDILGQSAESIRAIFCDVLGPFTDGTLSCLQGRLRAFFSDVSDLFAEVF
jgi:hypothetical protein